MNIQAAEFIRSSVQVSQCPPPTKPEFAFIGRSNVGKSSLINMIAQRRSLAKTSRLAGKTDMINHFLINNAWYLVDLPGYGYARRSHEATERWGEMIAQYLSRRENLCCVFMLLDARLTPQPIDIETLRHLQGEGKTMAIVLTKTDKLSGSKLAQVRREMQHIVSLDGSWDPPVFAVSATKRLGREELYSFIEQAIKS